jgi:hypothetical protein
MLKEERISAFGGVEDSDAEQPFKSDERQRDGEHWCCEHHDDGSCIV